MGSKISLKRRFLGQKSYWIEQNCYGFLNEIITEKIIIIKERRLSR